MKSRVCLYTTLNHAMDATFIFIQHSKTTFLSNLSLLSLSNTEKIKLQFTLL